MVPYTSVESGISVKRLYNKAAIRQEMLKKNICSRVMSHGVCPHVCSGRTQYYTIASPAKKLFRVIENVN